MSRRSSRRLSSSSKASGLFHDPIVEEVRSHREEHAAKFNFDLDRIFADVKQRERESGRKLVSLRPRPAKKSNVPPVKARRKKRS
jgi:hypothetical protein